ncbi:retropepsin-like aspartic protease [Cytophagales bacterium LB-30]|uniref:Retropepsin-like aspartic protease n=1 Tax=Shiella aurantiaca TaxID=3058365 RepID=A0ABT8F5V0_9BACT|nr:retropepsin-like aspartic protease [Shiella aurantiaca]MDN4165739.1 retropepsin-like aspartic protease [Shiella aurantiaca]
MKKLIVVLIFISGNALGQNLSLTQTVEYINDKLSKNQKVQYHNVYHDYKYLNQIEVTKDGTLIIYHFENNRSPNSSWRPCFLTKYTLSIPKSKIDYKSGNDYISFVGKTKYKSTSDCKNTSIETYIESNGFSLDFANGDEIGESIFNAFTYLFNLVNANHVLAPDSSMDDPFALKTVNPGGISTGSSSNVIKMERFAGVYTIPVVLNGVLKINFIYDSGASDVSISPDVAMTLVKTGTLKPEDFIGTQKYYFADGSSATSRVFYIREIQIGNHIITNIKASISNNIDAPMLLGQSVMQRFGRIIVDNELGTLTIIK